MSATLLTLAAKSAIALALGCAAAWLCRRRPAAVRHLVWLFTLVALLLLPLGLLIPESAAPRLSMIAVGATGAGKGQAAPSALNLPALLWAAGSALLLLRLATSVWRTKRLLGSGRSISHTHRREMDVRIADGLSAPAAWSFGSGVVVLPRDAARWTEDQLRAALDHEAAHLERKDGWALIAAELACALYWFNPLVWYAAARLRAEQEHAADDSVLQQGLAPADYAAGLAGIAARVCGEPLLAGAGAHSQLAGRVQAILDTHRRRDMLSRRMLLAGSAIAMLFAFPLAALQGERKVFPSKDEGVTPPTVIEKTEPKYTPEAKDSKIQGTVKLTIVIEADGAVSEATVKQSLDSGLDKNAVEALKTWKFKPATKDGKPVASRATVEINFRLD